MAVARLAVGELLHPESAVQVDFAGHTETYDDHGVTRRWIPEWNVLGVPYNYMVPGYLNGRVNTLRLWSAQATKAFDLQIFNAGDYASAVRAQTFAENISKVLYPEDSTPQGKEPACSSSTSSWRVRCATSSTSSTPTSTCTSCPSASSTS